MIRPTHGVVPGLTLQCAQPKLLIVSGISTKASDVGRPKIELWSTLCDPLGKRFARSTSRGDAECIEARPNKKVVPLWRLPKNEHAILREGL